MSLYPKKGRGSGFDIEGSISWMSSTYLGIEWVERRHRPSTGEGGVLRKEPKTREKENQRRIKGPPRKVQTRRVGHGS